MKKYSADFETATWLEDRTYVWAWALSDIDNVDDVILGNSIETFIEFLSKKSARYYFMNLKFDGEFIICYLETIGFKLLKNNDDITDNSYRTLISDAGAFYSIEIYFKTKGKKVKATIYDALKLIPMSVDKIPEAFGLDIEKLDLDYDTVRDVGHTLTEHEIAYISNDVKIPAIALGMLFKENLSKMTIGANALNYYKNVLGMHTFERLFPTIDKELDENLRKSYKGGFTYLNPIYKNKTNGETVNLDVNSLYPYCMRYKPLCYGDPIHYEGEYVDDKVYPLYIQKILVCFTLKKNMIPTIQIKKTYLFSEKEYLKSSEGEIIPLTLTSVDLKLFLEHYDTSYIEYVEGWKFKAKYDIFSDYIDYWIEVKNSATLEGNKGKRQLAKLLLNSLYGKFAQKLTAREKYPYLEDGIVKYETSEEKEKKGLYLPIGAFITSYARDKTIRTSQAITDYSLEKYGVDKYIYSDT